MKRVKFWNNKVFVKNKHCTNKFYASVGMAVCSDYVKEDTQVFESERKIDEIFSGESV